MTGMRNIQTRNERISGIVINRTGLHIIDPLISLVISAVILFNTVRLSVEALRTLFRR